MNLGLIGLGKMGRNLALNLKDNNVQVIGYDRDIEQINAMRSRGMEVAMTLKELVERLASPRVVWLMIPSGAPVQDTVRQLIPLLQQGDILIEGGNSYYRDSIQAAELCRGSGIVFFDVGTSGGMEGARHGACMMVGGDHEHFARIEPIIRGLCQEGGYLFAGPSGSGHYLKMVHNGIEYAMMQAIGEGFELLDKSGYDFDFAEVARLWSNGSVIRGWLMELTHRAFAKDAKLEQVEGFMQSSGEGRWTVETALALETSVPVIAMSLFMRYRSMDTEVFHGKVVSALRSEFGGHATVTKM